MTLHNETSVLINILQTYLMPDPGHHQFMNRMAGLLTRHDPEPSRRQAVAKNSGIEKQDLQLRAQFRIFTGFPFQMPSE